MCVLCVCVCVEEIAAGSELPLFIMFPIINGTGLANFKTAWIKKAWNKLLGALAIFAEPVCPRLDPALFVQLEAQAQQFLDDDNDDTAGMGHFHAVFAAYNATEGDRTKTVTLHFEGNTYQFKKLTLHSAVKKAHPFFLLDRLLQAQAPQQQPDQHVPPQQAAPQQQPAQVMEPQQEPPQQQEPAQVMEPQQAAPQQQPAQVMEPQQEPPQQQEPAQVMEPQQEPPQQQEPAQVMEAAAGATRGSRNPRSSRNPRQSWSRRSRNHPCPNPRNSWSRRSRNHPCRSHRLLQFQVLVADLFLVA